MAKGKHGGVDGQEGFRLEKGEVVVNARKIRKQG
jgi:hypothetical protein